MFARLSAVAALSLVAAFPAGAQLCAGAAPYTSGRMQGGAQILSNDDYSQYGVGLNMGTANGLWGGAQFGSNEYDFIEESGLWVGAGGGYQMRPARQGFQICPIANFGFGIGPDEIAGVEADVSIRQFQAGAIIGKVVHRTPTFQFIPTGGLSIVNSKFEVESGFGSGEESDTFFALDVGAGLVFNSVWTIRPMLSIPFGDDGRDESLVLGASYNFGRAATATPAGRRR
jgi:hypothetical protein